MRFEQVQLPNGYAMYKVAHMSSGDVEKRLHSKDNEPALVDGDTKLWYTDGVLIKKYDGKETTYYNPGSGPTVVHDDGTKEWRVNGELHRDNDLPAVEYANGDRAWYTRGEHARKGAPPFVYANGDKRWSAGSLTVIERTDGTKETDLGLYTVFKYPDGTEKSVPNRQH
jgi:hypothetical protein